MTTQHLHPLDHAAVDTAERSGVAGPPSRDGMLHRRRPRPWAVMMGLMVALLTTMALTAPSASANTPSDWSHRIAGTSITIGWTSDHAWVIADYADVIKYGSGFVASEVCSVLSGEEGFPNPVGAACGQATRQVVGRLVAGHPALTNHGIWAAFYPWPEHITGGTW